MAAVVGAILLSGCMQEGQETLDAAANKIDSRVAAAVQACIACHGLHGISALEQYPNLAGQKRAYLLNQMRAYRSGERENPLMTSLLQPYTDDVLVGLADYYSSLPPGGPDSP